MDFVLWLLVVGAIAGVVARFVVPGRDPIGIGGTIALGVVGSLIGGTLASLLFRERFELAFAGLLGSIIGAVIALLIWRRTRRGVHI